MQEKYGRGVSPSPCKCTVETLTPTERQSRPRVRKTPPPPPSKPVTRGPYVVVPRASVEPRCLSLPRSTQRAQTVAPSMTTTSSRHSGHAHTR